MVRTFDASLRLQSLDGKHARGSLQGVLYGCDTAGRLSSVSSNGYSVAYSYAANSLLLSELAMRNGAGGGLVVSVWGRGTVGARADRGLTSGDECIASNEVRTCGGNSS
jgi:hypothetical protein